MRHEVKKIAKIVNELTAFSLEYNAVNIDLRVRDLEDSIIITAIAKGITEIDEAVAHLREYLSYPRAKEMEEYYWGLAGDTESDEGLALISVMIDDVTIDYDDEYVYIRVKRLKHDEKPKEKPPKKEKSKDKSKSILGKFKK
ncbi:MAG: hypothetical protein ATN36_00890 [Epulopiscium sp. Nele67-Bin005]|nr:MAG: hypothetical protein ATN36_00890 [Epulopiscium sp. Nele67-Bin005]